VEKLRDKNLWRKKNDSGNVYTTGTFSREGSFTVTGPEGKSHPAEVERQRVLPD